MRNPALLILLSTALFSLSHTALADAGEAGVQPRANVIQSCSVVSPSILAFGVYDATGPNLTAHNDKQATFAVRCNSGSLMGGALSVSIDGGLNPAQENSCYDRKMSNGEDGSLTYSIYTNSSRNERWGCASFMETHANLSGVDTGTDHSIVMYGRISGGQSNAPAGSYSDTINISLSF